MGVRLWVSMLMLRKLSNVRSCCAFECEELLRIEQERYERENGVKKINKCETEVSYRAINATSSASLLRVYVLKIKEGSR